MIDRINNLNNDDYLQRLRSNDKKKAEAYKKTEKSSVLSNELSSDKANLTDKLNISDEAKEARQVQQFSDALKSIPDVRPEVVESAKNEIEAGTLDSPENIENTISSLINTIF